MIAIAIVWKRKTFQHWVVDVRDFLSSPHP
jgi:hypothetical protein